MVKVAYRALCQARARWEVVAQLSPTAEVAESDSAVCYWRPACYARYADGSESCGNCSGVVAGTSSWCSLGSAASN